MPEKEKINSHELMYNDTPMPFVIKTIEEVELLTGGITDLPHRHNYYTIIWSLQATGKHIIDFKEYPILPNDIFFVSPEQVHQVITNLGSTGFVILFTPEFLEKNSIRNDFISNLKLFQTSDETPPLQLNAPMTATLKTFADRMLEAFHNREEMYLETIGAYLKLFLIECNGHCSLFSGTNTQSVEVGKMLVKNFKIVVEKNYMKWHQVKEYADALNITPNYLNEVIRSSVNVTAKDFIQNRIILEAKRKLIFTDKNGKEIGFDLVFEDPSHFSKFFKSNTGMAMQEFKDSIVR